jgi:hypothetical protein
MIPGIGEQSYKPMDRRNRRGHKEIENGYQQGSAKRSQAWVSDACGGTTKCTVFERTAGVCGCEGCRLALLLPSLLGTKAKALSLIYCRFATTTYRSTSTYKPRRSDTGKTWMAYDAGSSTPIVGVQSSVKIEDVDMAPMRCALNDLRTLKRYKQFLP